MSLHCNTHCLDELIHDLIVSRSDCPRTIYDSEVDDEIRGFLKWLVEKYAQQKDELDG